MIIDTSEKIFERGLGEDFGRIHQQHRQGTKNPITFEVMGFSSSLCLYLDWSANHRQQMYLGANSQLR